ncbi:MAG TPA: hypothetical protein EYH22_01880 [Candidatus Nanopusillus sp.]|nr:hypothetical protein [Candidatus Nanopusillus sp.]
MAIIIPSHRARENLNRPKKTKKEKETKIIIYFRKEFDALDSKSYGEIVKAIQKAQELDLFDDIYIVKGKDVLDIVEFKEGYHAAAINEIYHIKKDILAIKSVVHGLLRIVRTLRSHLEKMYEKV